MKQAICRKVMNTPGQEKVFHTFLLEKDGMPWPSEKIVLGDRGRCLELLSNVFTETGDELDTQILSSSSLCVK